MPLYNYTCEHCGHAETDILCSVAKSAMRACSKCGNAMTRVFPRVIHTKIGVSVDGKDPGKKIQGKNDQLKRRESGYSHEEKNLREKIAKRVEEKERQG